MKNLPKLIDTLSVISFLCLILEMLLFIFCPNVEWVRFVNQILTNRIVWIFGFMSGSLVTMRAEKRRRSRDIMAFEGWPKKVSKRTPDGYRIWALQNKKDGHCIYDVDLYTLDGEVWGCGISEKDKYGHGSDQCVIRFYESIADFLNEWGLK